MRKNYTFLLLLLVFALSAVAQNNHWSYGVYNSGVSIPVSSAVTVITSTGKMYLAQTEAGTNTIWLSTINPTTMVAATYSYPYYQASSRHDIILRGGFEDFNGMIVLYGYCYDNVGYNYGYVAEIDPNNFFTMTNREPSVEGEIIRGCSGYSPTGSAVNMFVFNEGEIYAIDVFATAVFPGPFYYRMQYNGQQGYFSDVQWDPSHNCFVASGNYFNTSAGMLRPFIVCFEFITGTHQFNPLYQYDVGDNTYSNWSEGRSLISIIDDDHLVLYQDMRDNSYDIIWLTLLKGYCSSSPAILNSTYFLVPLHKLSAYGMVYEKYNNRLNLLGQFDYCIPPTTFLAQTDPFNLTYLNIGQITSPTSNDTCYSLDSQLVMGNSIRLNNITINPFNPCSTVISTGVSKNSVGNTAYLTETYDISLSSCDTPLSVSDSPVSPNSTTIPTPLQQVSTYSTFVVNQNTPYFTSTIKECNDGTVCFKEMNDTIRDSTRSISTQESMGMIYIEKGHFVCSGFDGIIHYEIFSSTGKLVCKGETSNDEQNSLCADKPGLYIFRCADNSNQIVITKFIVAH